MWDAFGYSGRPRYTVTKVTTNVPAAYPYYFYYDYDSTFAAVLKPDPLASGAAVDAIINPNFDQPLSTGWTVVSSVSLQVSETGFGGVVFSAASGQPAVAVGDSASLAQNVDFTGIETLSFGIQSFGSSGTCEVLIDGAVVWSETNGVITCDILRFPSSTQPSEDIMTQELSVSYLNGGQHLLECRLVALNPSALSLYAEFFDFATYGPLRFAPAGTLESLLLPNSYSPAPEPALSWGMFAYTVSIPDGTSLTVDVLDRFGNLLAANVSSGTNLGSITAVASHSAIKLRANLSTTNPSLSPALGGMSLTWQPVPSPVPNGFSGVVFQKQNIAVGVFNSTINGGELGTVILTPQ
jgi:hypothetical protein